MQLELYIATGNANITPTLLRGAPYYKCMHEGAHKCPLQQFL